MKLRTKGFLVVGIPLVLQVLTLSVLAFLLLRAQDIAIREARAKDIIYECNHMTVGIAKVIQSVFRSDRKGGVLPRNMDQTDVEQIRDSVGKLQSRLELEPAEADNANLLASFAEQFISDMKAARNAAFSKDEELHGTSDMLEYKMMADARKLIKVFQNIAALETQVHPDQPEIRKQARMLIRYWLLAAVGFTVLLALALAYFCSVTIRKPLLRMVQNSVRISTRQPLEPELKGADELAVLDRKLHIVNDSIEHALNAERNMINYAADLVFSVDRHGVFLSVNPFAKAMLGYDPDELIGMSVLEVISEENRAEVKATLTSNYKGRESLLFETKMQGRTGVIETSWSVIYSQRDKTFFCVAHDITERKHVERLKQDFIAMISHDLRTPLMSVSSSINLVQSGATGEISPVIERELNSAEKSVDHLIELVNDLLDFEKLEAGRMNFEFLPIPVNSVIEESIRMVEALASERKVTIDSPKTDYTISGDERKLIQVTVNLLSNALKHSPESSVIQVITRRIDGMLEVAIHDQGPGVPDEYAEKIFAPFEQISHRPTAALGTGLGLAICKLIVEGHGGKIAVRHSEFLQGSAFWYSLQFADANASATPTVSSVALR